MKRPTREIIAKASATRNRGITREPHVAICIIKQLHYHVLASQAARRIIEARDAGKMKEARKAQIEARRWYRMYQKHGGTKPL
jgi:hypothetical protein